MTAPRLVRIGHGVAVVGLLVSLTSGALLVTTTPAEAATTPVRAAAEDSSTTVVWDDGTRTPTSTDPAVQSDYDSFKNLKVTVSQTKNLTNQGVVVSWTGAQTTSPGEYAYQYLQVMQCWGDPTDADEATTGPIPQHCEFGTPNSTLGNQLGTQAAVRDLVADQDPEQSYSDDIKLPPTRDEPNRRAYRIPFVTPKGESNFDVQQFFNSDTTNELDAVRTGADGTGSAPFEVQTSVEAPQLGCGADATDAAGATAPRDCWLVIVPRGGYSVDHTPASQGSNGRIYGSAFSASAWRNRMVVKLGFQSIASSCTIGADERRVVGSEMVSDAFTSWQSALCGLGTTYGFSQIGDSQGRRTILQSIDGGSKLAFVSNSVDAATAGDATMAYAPAAQTSLVVGYNIDYNLVSDASNYSKNGTRVQDMTLNARLVAKLLTQSYQYDVPGLGLTNATIKKNPRSIVQDPEFIALNPNFAGFTSQSAPDGLMVALGDSDSNALVWQWLRSDPLANAFLSGKADDWGMKINPSYAALGLATDTSIDSFPKADLTTYKGSADEPGYGTLDMRPYMNDMHEGAQRALRGDANVKIVWDETKAPPAYTSGGAQLPGRRFELTLTDAAAAARYGLNTAKLVNGAGQAVAATDGSVQASIDALEDSKGVKTPNPGARTVGAYPLAMPVYAAINVCAATDAERTDYVKLLGYATGRGQVSGDARGQLPRGYVPLTSAEVKQTAAVATTLTKANGKKGVCTPKKTDPVTPPDDGGSSNPPTTGGGTTVDVPPATTDVPPVTAPTQPASEPTATATAPVPAKLDPTADVGFDLSRLALGLGLAGGIPMTLAGSLLARHGRRLAALKDAASRLL